MIRRLFRSLFWLTIGVVLGIFIWRKLTKVAHSYSPEGIAERAQAGAQQANSEFHSFVGDVRRHSAQRETELRRQLDAKRPSRDSGSRGAQRRGDGR